MRLRYFSCSAIVTVAALYSDYAVAQTATDQFNVQITINAECLINSSNDLDFGSSGVIATAVESTSDIAVLCSSGTAYNIGLNAGQGAGATVSDRLMTGPNAETVTYSLYTAAPHTNVWGDTIGTDAVAGTGTGAEQLYTVFGQVPIQNTPAPGSYSDIITVTMTY